VLGELPGAEPWRGEVLRRAAVFQAALRDGDGAAPALSAARALAGLGEGSTPAGDDYLVGVLHAIRFGGGGARADFASLLASEAAARTSTASAGWLLEAGRGAASPRWQALLDALEGADESAVDATARAVRASGHTSGAFSLRGFLDTLRCLPQGVVASSTPRAAGVSDTV